MSKQKRKEEKLQHYSGKPLTEFIQFDVFTDQEKDAVMNPDEDKECCFKSMTEELMTGYYAVRILIKPGTSKKVALRALRKISNWIEKDPGLLQREKDDDSVPF